MFGLNRRLLVIAISVASFMAVTGFATDAFGGLKQDYNRAYHKVQHRFGHRAPGRNIVKWGFDQSRRPATKQEIRDSLAILRRMLHYVPSLQPVAHVQSPSQSGNSATASTERSSTRAQVGSGSSGTASGGWAIPSSIVQCESGGQNLAPNGATASGYYQIIDSTWRANGGSTSSAYLASKAEQDRIAAKIYAGGAGRSQWVC